MFFFLVGGVKQQVREILHRDAAKCLRCGYPANLVNYDNVLELFFVPVWRWRAKQPALHCSNCGFLVPTTSHLDALPHKQYKSSPSQAPRSLSRSSCWSCTCPLDPSFKYCPHCGARQDL